VKAACRSRAFSVFPRGDFAAQEIRGILCFRLTPPPSFLQGSQESKIFISSLPVSALLFFGIFAFARQGNLPIWARKLFFFFSLTSLDPLSPPRFPIPLWMHIKFGRDTMILPDYLLVFEVELTPRSPNRAHVLPLFFTSFLIP